MGACLALGSLGSCVSIHLPVVVLANEIRRVVFKRFYFFVFI